MPFDGNEGGFIPLNDASLWTANYRNSPGSGTRAHFFGKNKLLQVLDQPNCVGIRAYYAIDDAGQKQLVVVGVDTNEKDITHTSMVLDQSYPCPSECDSASPLNQDNVA